MPTSIAVALAPGTAGAGVAGTGRLGEEAADLHQLGVGALAPVQAGAHGDSFESVHQVVLGPDRAQRRAWRIFNRPNPMAPEIRILGPPGRELRRVLCRESFHPVRRSSNSTIASRGTVILALPVPS